MTKRTLLPLAFLALLAVGLCLELPASPVAAPAPPPAQSGTFPPLWIHGAECGTEPDVQIHAYNDDLYILRQSPCADFEAPFLYMIFGQDRVLLYDTGSAPQIALVQVVRRVIDEWLASHNQVSIELVVAHSHSHGDHIQNDNEFANLPNTTLVAPSLADMTQFFGFTNWPEEIVSYDLGGRVLDVIPTPGHGSDCIALYDAETQLLLTNDTVYPGRLYVFGARLSGQWDVFKASVQRLVDFAQEHPVTWVLGCHIEMTAEPRVDFAYATTYHPDEHVLQLEIEDVYELNAAIQPLADPQLVILDDLIVHPAF